MRRWSRPPYIAAAVVVIGVAIGIGVAFAITPNASHSATASAATRHVPKPAGPNPSTSAQMVCAPEAQTDLTSTLGIAATSVTTPTWTDHVYACQYLYPSGTVSLSVKELANQATTDRYYASLRSQLGQVRQLKGFGQGAFTTHDGSLVLRKDYKVLLVDTSKLTVPFGQGLNSRSQVATAVALTVLGCWTGS
jgi:hypothetical protein